MKRPLPLVVGAACALLSLMGPVYAAAPEESMSYYEELKARCGAMEDPSCCLKSVEAMQAKRMREKWGEMCADGSWPDGLECLGSYSWCKNEGRVDNGPQMLPNNPEQP